MAGKHPPPDPASPPSAPDPRDATRQRIVARARQEFFTHGFRGYTMDDLAAELGMSKKTLYAIFPSKCELVQAVLNDKIREAEARFAALQFQQPLDFVSGVQQLVGCVQQVTQEIRPPFVRDLEREAPEMFQMIQTHRRELILTHFKRFFDQGRKAGAIRGDISVTLMIEILLGAVEAIANPKKMMELGLIPETALPVILKVILEGVVTRPGRKS